MADNTRNEQEPGVVQTLGSLQFGITILIAIAVVSIAGTLLPQGQPFDFYTDHYSAPVTTLIRMFNLNDTYRSPLFIGLLGLLGLNLVLCSLIKFPGVLRSAMNPNRTPGLPMLASMPVYIQRVGTTLDEVGAVFGGTGYRLEKIGNDRLFGEKGRLGRFGATLVHLSLLVLLTGGVTSLLTSVRGQIVLHPGETVDQAMLANRETIPLGFEITLDRFDVSFYEDFPGRPRSYSSKVTVKTPDGDSFDRDIRVNHPLMMNNLTIYQSGYDRMTDDPGMAAEGDTARVAIRLNGAPEEMPPITTVDMTVGEELMVPGFGDSITVELTELYRDFQALGAQSGERNPAARFNIATSGGMKWSIYAFQRFPGMNMPMDPARPVLLDLLDIAGSGPSEPAEASPPEYYTVLGVTRDRGASLMWLGSLILMAGLVLSFYVRPRRIWVFAEGGVIHIAAAVKGDPARFRAFVMKIIPGKKPKS